MVPIVLAVVLVVAFFIWLAAELIPGAPVWVAKVSLILVLLCLVIIAVGVPTLA